MQTITPELRELLKATFQAGASGFRGRVEVDTEVPYVPPADPCAGGTYAPTPSGYYPPNNGSISLSPYVHYIAAGVVAPEVPTPGYHGKWFYPTYGTAGSPDRAFGSKGNNVRIIIVGTGQLTVASTLIDVATTVTITELVPDAPPEVLGSGPGGTPLTVTLAPTDRCVRVMNVYATAHTNFAGLTWLSDYSSEGDPVSVVVPLSYQARRIAIDKSLRMTSDQASVEFANEDLPLGWGPASVFPSNSRIRIFQWYGDPSNAVRTFTGVIDTVVDSRDPLTSAIACRDMMAILLDQTFGAFAPQGADEAGADRTTDNGVYLTMEISAIVEDILDRAGWPADKRAIATTSYVLDEYVLSDGWSWAEAIIGDDRLTGMAGYSAWADEDGVFRFLPTYQPGPLTLPVAPDYTFRSGEDLVSLQDATDQYDLRTRVKVRGPLTTATLTDTWREQWRTHKFARPVGIWHDPADAANLRVLDRGTKRIYRLRQSDRVVLSSYSIGSVVPHPIGISGDPADATIYWVLNAPWIYTGSTSGNSIRKIRKSDNHLLATYALPNQRWSAIKAGATHLWLTNLDTDELSKRSKADGTGVANYQHVISGVTQANPSGLMIDGSTISVFWANGGTTARFAVCDVATPGTVDKVVKTTGTTLHGGEMDTVTHTHCYGDSDSAGLVAKFTLAVAGSITNEVYAEVVDTELEDELGALAQLEPRQHDAHPEAAHHPYEVRRDTLDLIAITSLAQATETAMRRLELLAQRRRVLDAGIIGNPALQKTDVVRVEDPPTGLASDWVVDTYRSEMSADGTYLGTLALLGVSQPADEPTEIPTDEPPATDDTVPGYWPMLALTSNSRTE